MYSRDRGHWRNLLPKAEPSPIKIAYGTISKEDQLNQDPEVSNRFSTMRDTFYSAQRSRQALDKVFTRNGDCHFTNCLAQILFIV